MAGLIEMNAFIGKFVKLWQSGRDANLKIESKAGQAVVSLQLDLGYPHPPPPHHPVPVVRAAQVRRRQRRAAERQTAAEADREEAKAEEAAEKAAVEAESECVKAEQADRDCTEAAEHERAEAAKAAHDEAEQAGQALAVQTAPLDQDYCNDIVNIPHLDGEPEEGLEENDGQEAFKCLQCKLLFIPGSHMHGNEIFDYESCRRHLGVNKCRNCALPLIGLDRMRAHMERCHEPA